MSAIPPVRAYIGVDGHAYRELIPVKAIEIVRAEGPSDLCGKVQRSNGWTGAFAILLGNGRFAPKGGAYDKHDFKVTWEDGFEYAGRYDLQHPDEARPDLAAHVRGSLEYMAGLWWPRAAHYRLSDIPAIEANYRRWLAEHDQLRQDALRVLATYDIQQKPVALDPEITSFEVVRDYRTQPLTTQEFRL